MKFIKLLMALLASAALLAGCGGVDRSSPDAVAIAFATAVCKGDAKAAMDLLHFEEGTTDEVKKAKFETLRKQVESSKKQADGMGGLKSMEVTDKKTRDKDTNRVLVDLRMHFANKDEGAKVEVIREGDKWDVLM